MGRREERREATRQAIIEAALQLFEERGLRRVTVEDIAARAGCGRTTFFRHFRSKQDVLFWHTETQTVELSAALRAHPDAALSRAGLRRALLAFAAAVDRDRHDLARNAAQIHGDESLTAQALKVRASWEELLVGEMTRQWALSEPTLEIRVIASAAVAAVHMAFRHWRLNGREGSMIPHVESAFDVIGLSATA
jgi:AcrR family transcriptional regulator